MLPTFLLCRRQHKASASCCRLQVLAQTCGRLAIPLAACSPRQTRITCAVLWHHHQHIQDKEAGMIVDFLPHMTCVTLVGSKTARFLRRISSDLVPENKSASLLPRPPFHVCCLEDFAPCAALLGRPGLGKKRKATHFQRAWTNNKDAQRHSSFSRGSRKLKEQTAFPET